MKKLKELLKSGLGLGLLLAFVLVLAWLFGAQKDTRPAAQPEPKVTAVAPTGTETVEATAVAPLWAGG